MKLYFKLSLLVMAIVASGCFGSSKNPEKNRGISQTTGWKYNDPKQGGFEVITMNDQPVAPGLVFIPGGTFTMGRVAQDLPYDWNNEPRRVSVDSYFIDATEVRNVDYREYIHWLQLIYVSFPEVAHKALPDTLSWRKPLAYNEPLVEYYFRLAVYNDYPVVAVSWLQANQYCEWRTDRVNEMALIKAGVLESDILDQRDENSFSTDAYLSGQYLGKVRKNLPDITGRNADGRSARFEDGILFPKYRLPTEAEWEYAAVAPLGDEETGMLPDRGVYPWKGNRVRQTDGPDRGKMMANFQKGRGDLMGVAGIDEGSSLLPMEVNSFWPNDFGLYCMAGNVNEWVLDVYRATSFEEVDDARPFRGNVYTEIKKGEDGKPLRDSLGRMTRDTIGYLGDKRPNYNRGDNRNFRDGDMFSAINAELDITKKEGLAASNRMYSQGTGANHLGMTSLVNEESRVYKGGSFLDRAYWLSPGARRFLDQRFAKEDLGFRCAMDRMGTTGRNRRQ